MTRNFESYSRVNNEASAASNLTGSVSKMQETQRRNEAATMYGGGRFRPRSLQHMVAVLQAFAEAEMVLAVREEARPGADLPARQSHLTMRQSLVDALRDALDHEESELGQLRDYNSTLPGPSRTPPGGSAVAESEGFQVPEHLVSPEALNRLFSKKSP